MTDDTAVVRDLLSQVVPTLQYSCQKCKNPIYLTADLENLRGPDLASIIGEEFSLGGSFSRERYTSSGFDLSNSGFNYGNLSPAHATSATASSMDHRLQVNAHLFDMLSGRTKVSHPMCQECADILINTQKQLLDFQRDELASLQAYLVQLDSKTGEGGLADDDASKSSDPVKPNVFSSDEASDSTFFSAPSDTSGLQTSASHITVLGPDNASPPSPVSSRPLFRCSSDGSELLESSCDLVGRENSPLQKEEAELAALQQELTHVLKESSRLDEQIAECKIELERSREKLDQTTNAYNQNKLQLLEEEESLSILEARLRDARHQYDRLRRTKVLNAAFPIWYDGHIGVINGLHLGRLPNKPIEWSEINAAWGQCTLLLQCLAKKLSVTFSQYSLVPLGTQSQIIHLASDRSYPLYNSTGSIRLFNAGKKFDTAMTMFLECVGQLQERVECQPKFELPYRILEKGRMRDTDGQIYCIKITGNLEENWTKCLKMMLINIKWIILSSVAVQ